MSDKRQSEVAPAGFIRGVSEAVGAIPQSATVLETEEEFRVRILGVLPRVSAEEFDRVAEVLLCDPGACDQDDCTGWCWMFRRDAPYEEIAEAIMRWTRTAPPQAAL